MKAVSLFEVGNLRIVDKEVPEVGENEVLIRVGACGIV